MQGHEGAPSAAVEALAGLEFELADLLDKSAVEGTGRCAPASEASEERDVDLVEVVGAGERPELPRHDAVGQDPSEDLAAPAAFEAEERVGDIDDELREEGVRRQAPQLVDGAFGGIVPKLMALRPTATFAVSTHSRDVVGSTMSSQRFLLRSDSGQPVGRSGVDEVETPLG